MRKIIGIVSILVAMCAVDLQGSERAAKKECRDKKGEGASCRYQLFFTKEQFVAVLIRYQIVILKKELEQSSDQKREQAMKEAAKRHTQRALHASYLEGALEQVVKPRLVPEGNRSAL